ncbi:MAG: RnfABCDGE type electron transport complex subunit B [Bacteroidales bacterium]|nr:RnfABCDGE type electron transport complex subunit B [Bacteroidales bacterium]
MSVIVWTIIVIASLAVILAAMLFFISKKFKVEEDPRIDVVEKLMPGANCGGCGFAGCHAFAEAAVRAEDLESIFCPVGGVATMKNVAEALGKKAVEKAPQVAVVRCNGCKEVREKTTIYGGTAKCSVIAALYAGDTGCGYGCLGCGDCVGACEFGALSMNAQTGLPEVDEAKCTSCGKCVKACPKGVIELRNKGPRSMRVFVSCINRDKGAVARKACKNACIGCGKCAKVCTHDAITVENNVAYIDFSKCKLCKKCVSECPTGAIHALNFPAPKPVATAPTPAASPASKPETETKPVEEAKQ